MRNILSKLFVAVVAASIVSGPREADAACVFPPYDGEARLFPCADSWFDYFWRHYDMHEVNWNQGWGFSNACDMSLPLGRTFNGIYALHYSDGPQGDRTDDFSRSILHWGSNYALREIDELDGECTSGGKRARTVTGLDDYTDLYKPFFYEEPPVWRAGTLLHEARHADYCSHNGNDDSDGPRCPARSDSCDESRRDGCTGIGSPRGSGAVTFQVDWLWAFTIEADPTTTGTPAAKIQARDEANRLLNTMYDKLPCFNITNTGAGFLTC